MKIGTTVRSVTVNLSPKAHQRLLALAAERQCSNADVVRAVIEQHLVPPILKPEATPAGLSRSEWEGGDE